MAGNIEKANKFRSEVIELLSVRDMYVGELVEHFGINRDAFNTRVKNLVSMGKVFRYKKTSNMNEGYWFTLDPSKDNSDQFYQERETCFKQKKGKGTLYLMEDRSRIEINREIMRSQGIPKRGYGIQSSISMFSLEGGL